MSIYDNIIKAHIKRPKNVTKNTLVLPKKLSMTRVEWVSKTIRLPTSSPIKIPGSISKFPYIDYTDRPYLVPILNNKHDRLLLLAGRQTEKSTTVSNILLSDACNTQGIRWLYVSPSNKQTKSFSKDRIRGPLAVSERLQLFSPNYINDNVHEKHFINSSIILLRYAFLSADRIRGDTVHRIAIDEFQDILLENVPVIEESMSHSEEKARRIWTGTPKSEDNGIEFYWQTQSTQNEWMVPCDHCGTSAKGGYRYWNTLGEKNMGLKSLICSRCGKPINFAHPHAQWVSQVTPRGDIYFEGYRIPQLMVPWHNTEKGYTELVHKRNTYARYLFHNEVLGRSYDSGRKAFTVSVLQGLSDSRLSMAPAELAKLRAALPIGQKLWAGIDWGTGEQTYTVLTISTYIDGIFTCIFMKRFIGEELERNRQISSIVATLRYWKVSLVGVDYGGGTDAIPMLMKIIGANKVFKYQSVDPNWIIKWQPLLSRFVLNRTEVMSRLITAMTEHNGKPMFRFPAWLEWEKPYAADFLSIYSSYNTKRRQDYYEKVAGATDDTFFSFMYGFLVSCLERPRHDILHYELVK